MSHICFRDTAVEVLTLPPIKVAVLEHHGDPTTLAATLETFRIWRRKVGYHPRQHPTYTILHGAPDPEAPQDFRVDICTAIYDPLPDNDEGIIARTLPGGRYAVMRVPGNDQALHPALEFLCGDWMSRSGETRRPDPIILHRVSLGMNDPDQPDTSTPPDMTDILLPLE